MNPFLRYLADKNSAHTQTDRQTDRHTPMTTRPCGLRRAGKDTWTEAHTGRNPNLHQQRGGERGNTYRAGKSGGMGRWKQ